MKLSLFFALAMALPQSPSNSVALAADGQSKFMPVNFCFSCGGGCGGGCSCGGDSGCGSSSSGGSDSGSSCSSGDCGGDGPIVIGGHGGGAYRMLRGPIAQMIQQQHAQLAAQHAQLVRAQALIAKGGSRSN